MKIKWLGHACFLITTDSGVKIITDPYKSDNSILHGEIKESADVVTVSHEHFDHNNAGVVRGNPVVLRQNGEVKGIRFRVVPSYHDTSQGRQRGINTIFCFNPEGLNVCHLGDLGHVPDDRQMQEIGKVDVLLVPVGGTFTIDAAGASEIVERLKPVVIIPMHFKNDRIRLPVASVDNFLKGKSNVVRFDTSEIEIRANNLPPKGTIYVLKPAL